MSVFTVSCDKLKKVSNKIWFHQAFDYFNFMKLEVIVDKKDFHVWGLDDDFEHFDVEFNCDAWDVDDKVFNSPKFVI